MPIPDRNIDTRDLGLALAFASPGKHNGKPRNSWRIEFDSGIVLFVPPAMFEGMKFNLAEADR